MTAETSARNLLCRLICAVFAFALGVAGCGIQLIFPGRVGAQTRTVSHGNFTPSSAVKRLDENTWLIGVEALLPPPDPGSTVIVANRDFELPPNGTITKLQGTFGFVAPFGTTSYTSCINPNAALGIISVDGKNIPFAVHVDSGGHRDRDIFFSYDARVHIEANPLGCWSDVEIQALMRVEFH
jgi:hypothetical protein